MTLSAKDHVEQRARRRDSRGIRRPSAAACRSRGALQARAALRVDLLYLDRYDLRGARLAERKRLLAELLADASERILFAEHLEGEGAQIQERAGAMGVIVETPASPPNL